MLCRALPCPAADRRINCLGWLDETQSTAVDKGGDDHDHDQEHKNTTTTTTTTATDRNLHAGDCRGREPALASEALFCLVPVQSPPDSIQ